MRQKFLLFAMLTCSLAWNTAKATESEPNDTKVQASVLALNGSDNGSIGTATDVDWWSVTTTGDGKLDATITVSNGLNLYCAIYDNDGNKLFVQAYTTSTITISQDGLAAGTYYLKVFPYYGGQMPVYTISNTLTVPAQANDVEPNGTVAQAKVLPLNGSRTGHIGYYYNNLDDTTDWYKVTTTADGQLNWTITSVNGKNVYAQLYDVNGTTYLGGGYTTSTATYSKNGLAVGTYYIKIFNFYISEFAPYTISNTLTLPSVSSDLEPNGLFTQALNINVGDSAYGHIGYANFNGDDTTDWYKVTTTQDGRIDFTMTSLNGQNIYLQLYDNDGVTFLAGSYTTSTATYSKDGLAAGTYYLKIFNFYLSEFSPYQIKVNLVTPAQANDIEPNDVRAQALNFAINTTNTGHINYLNNNHKDTLDWYKITIPQDGSIAFTITSHNGKNVYAQLFDNDAITYLVGNYTTTTASYVQDGLAAGTYYLRIKTFYSSEFAPYTISNTFTTYLNTNDAEPNNTFSQAKTLPANVATTGHVNFYYNGAKDAIDYHKINYTGTGNLTLLFNQENRIKYGSATPTWFQVYKDTAASPISSGYYYASSGNINLTGLTQGYYYIKVFCFYNGTGVDFSAYSITPTFVQDNIATIAYNNPGTIAAPNCDSTNTAAFKCAGSNAPYTVQLFRFGVPYGSPRIVNNTNVFSFTGLPNGSYLARVFGDGATGTAFGSAPSRALEPVPGNAATGVITATSAKVTFDNFTCVDGYRLQHRKVGVTTWIYDTVLKSPNTLRNLAPATQYEWQVVSGDTLGTYTAISELSSLQTFTTLSAFASTTGDNSNVTAANTGAKGLITYPNPTSVQFKIQYNSNTNAKLSATLKDMNGRTVWSKLNVAATAINGTTVDVSKLQPGIYILQVAGANNSMAETRKIVVSR